MGHRIDEYPVCRLKCYDRFWNLKDYGERTDYLCSTTEVAALLPGRPSNPLEYWVYAKYGEVRDPKKIEQLKGKLLLPLEATNKWNAWFQHEMGYTGDKILGRNYSTGASAAVIAMECKDFKRIIFAGFDTLMNPAVPYESVYNPGTVHCANHGWQKENEMIHLLAKEKGVELCVLSPHSVEPATPFMAKPS